ncbi:MAG: pirin family protein, partial [Gammaproteobacteria bacterium]|nr:pirin family protein [Gammaproteobacteria bacterium]
AKARGEAAVAPLRQFVERMKASGFVAESMRRHGIEGARVAGPVVGLATQPLFVDLALPVGAALSLPLPATHNAFIYVYEGALSLPGGALVARHGGVLGAGDRIEAVAGEAGARCLLLAARPIGEPVVQYGPFVMNTREEIEQAVRDYHSGRLAAG